MKSFVMLVMTSLLAMIVLCTPTNADFTLVLERKQNFQVYWDTLEDGLVGPLQSGLPGANVGLVGSRVGHSLIAGETLFVSWKITEQSVVPPVTFLLTKEQSLHFGHMNPFNNYLLKTIGWEGNLTYTMAQNGTYCVILDNPAWGALDLTGPILSVEFYEADLTVSSQTLLSPHGPKADFTITPETANVGEKVTFDASASMAGWNGTNQMPITEYRWDFGDGNKTTSSTVVVYHTFSSSGIYYVSLTVFAPRATPETDSVTHRVLIVTVPVGGYAISLKEKSTAMPLALYLSITMLLTAILPVTRSKKRKKFSLLS
jgi:hypothetical protein